MLAVQDFHYFFIYSSKYINEQNNSNNKIVHKREQIESVHAQVYTQTTLVHKQRKGYLLKKLWYCVTLMKDYA